MARPLTLSSVGFFPKSLVETTLRSEDTCNRVARVFEAGLMARLMGDNKGLILIMYKRFQVSVLGVKGFLFDTVRLFALSRDCSPCRDDNSLYAETRLSSSQNAAAV